jgi:hypothetical protein
MEISTMGVDYEKTLMHDRLHEMSHANTVWPGEHDFALYTCLEIAWLIDPKSGVKFRWSPSEDTVWVTYTRKFDSLEFTSVPWKMSKDHARKLWAEMVTLGWEWQGRNDHG